MATGDFLVRRNAAETTTVSGSNFDSTWDTEVFDKGSTITYSAGVFTVPDTAPYLIIYNEQFKNNSATHSNATTVISEIAVNGTSVDQGRGSVCIAGSNSSFDAVLNGAGIVELTAGDEVAIRMFRDDTGGVGTATRVAGVGGVQIFQISTQDPLLSWTAGSSQTIDGSNDNVEWNTRTRTDSVFGEGGGLPPQSIQILEDGKYIICASVDVSGIGAMGASITATGNPLKVISKYLSGSSGADRGASSCISLVTFTEFQSVLISHRNYSGFSSTLNAGTSIQMWKLPEGWNSQEIIVEATTGDINVVGDFAWDTLKFIEEDTYTHTAGNTNIDVDVSDHYLAISNLSRGAAVDTTNSDYAVPRHQFAVEDVVIGYGAGSVTDRYLGASTQNRIGAHAAAILTNVSGSYSVEMVSSRLNSTKTGTITAQAGVFQLLNIGSMYDPATHTTAGSFTTSATLAGTTRHIKAVYGSIDVSATLAADATAFTNPLVGTFNAAAHLEGNPIVVKVGAGSFSTSGDLTGAAILIKEGAGTLSATATLSANALGSSDGAGSFEAAATLQGDARVFKVGAGAFSVSGDLSGVYTVTGPGEGTLSATASLSGETKASSLIKDVAFNASASLSADALVTKFGVGSFSATAALESHIITTHDGAGSFSAAASLSGDTVQTFSVSGLISGNALLLGDTVATFRPTGTLLAEATLQGDHGLELFATGSFVATASMVSNVIFATHLIAEDGTGIEDANSYTTLEFADAYHLTRGNTEWAARGTLAREAALFKAADYIKFRFGPRLRGEPADNIGLLFPREQYSAYYDNGLPIEGLPTAIKKAAAEYALLSLNDELYPETINSGVIAVSRSVGSLSDTTAYAETGSSPWFIHPVADGYLYGFLINKRSDRE